MTEGELYDALETASTPDALLIVADWIAQRLDRAERAVEEIRDVAEGLGAEHVHGLSWGGECRCGAVVPAAGRADR